MSIKIMPLKLPSILTYTLKILGIAIILIYNSFAAEKYRMDHYHAPTPLQVEGAETIDTQALTQLLTQNPKPLLINVMALTFRAETIDFGGEWLLNKPYYQLPHSLWLPNVGYGELTPEWLIYFKTHLQEATQNNLNYPIVFYCVADCWMSWNASKRAHELGYTQIYWYRDGNDGWQDAGLSLEEATPIPFNITTSKP